MATEAYVDDVFTLVQALTRAEITRALIERASDADDSTQVHILLRVDGPELRPAIAAQQSLQLSLDAAAIVVERFSTDGSEIGRDRVEAILRDRIVDLTIVELANGSFLGRFSIDIRTARGRRRLLAIAGLVGVAMTFVYPPAGVALLVLGGLGNLDDILTPDTVRQPQPAGPGASVPIKTVEQSDAQPGQQVSVVIQPGVHRPAAGPEVHQPQRHVIDVDLDGPQRADEEFRNAVLRVASVEAQSRFIIGDRPGGPRRIRIWSAEPLDTVLLHRLAVDAGTSIVGISPVGS